MSYRQIALQTGHRDLETLMKVYDHPDREKAKEAFEAALGGAPENSGRGTGMAGARDLLGSLDKKDLLVIFRELLLATDAREG